MNTDRKYQITSLNTNYWKSCYSLHLLTCFSYFEDGFCHFRFSLGYKTLHVGILTHHFHIFCTWPSVFFIYFSYFYGKVELDFLILFVVLGMLQNHPTACESFWAVWKIFVEEYSLPFECFSIYYNRGIEKFNLYIVLSSVSTI